jgi:hypothetical protein
MRISFFIHILMRASFLIQIIPPSKQRRFFLKRERYIYQDMWYNRVIPKVTLSSPCLWASFHPLSPLSAAVSAK